MLLAPGCSGEAVIFTDVSSALSAYCYRARKGTKDWALSCQYVWGSPCCYLDNLEKKTVKLVCKRVNGRKEETGT